jgi:hypothetical protein
MKMEQRNEVCYDCTCNSSVSRVGYIVKKCWSLKTNQNIIDLFLVERHGYYYVLGGNYEREEMSFCSAGSPSEANPHLVWWLDRYTATKRDPSWYVGYNLIKEIN